MLVRVWNSKDDIDTGPQRKRVQFCQDDHTWYILFTPEPAVVECRGSKVADMHIQFVELEQQHAPRTPATCAVYPRINMMDMYSDVHRTLRDAGITDRSLKYSAWTTDAPCVQLVHWLAVRKHSHYNRYEYEPELAYLRSICERTHAAIRIQRAYRAAIANPNIALCQQRLRQEFEALQPAYYTQQPLGAGATGPVVNMQMSKTTESRDRRQEAMQKW